jgi:phospholipase/carboxylesterase
MLKHVIISKDKESVLIFFHGTGGTEHDFLDMGEHLDKDATLIGLRGNVVEGSLTRFFKRKAPGVFDVDNLKEETKHVYETLLTLAKQHQFDMKNVTLIGYSNGANMIGSLLFHYGDFVRSAILMHPMVPLRDFKVSKMNDLKLLITAGHNDPICDRLEATTLNTIFQNANASVALNWYSNGHRISSKELKDIQDWYRNNH